MNRPEFSRYDVEGKDWIIEGRGVEPDIMVDNDPAREYAGVDDQLNKAIEVIKAEMLKHPVNLPPPPPYPTRASNAVYAKAPPCGGAFCYAAAVRLPS